MDRSLEVDMSVPKDRTSRIRTVADRNSPDRHNCFLDYKLGTPEQRHSELSLAKYPILRLI